MHTSVETELPLTLGAKLAAGRSALVVVDMQNDFCAPGGYIAEVMKKPVDAAATVVPKIQAVLDEARACGVPVYWVGADYSLDAIPRSMRVKLAARGITQPCCAPGTWGADWFGVQPQPGEPVVIKHTYSAFFQTSLHEQLQAAGVQTLVFVGVQTQVCVESAVRDAHSLGYYCVVVSDAVASHTAHLHAASLDCVRFLFGDVHDADEVRAAWRTSADA